MKRTSPMIWGLTGSTITDEDADRIEVVGDLIRHIESVDNKNTRRPFGRDCDGRG
jgi:hypothetical protein